MAHYTYTHTYGPTDNRAAWTRRTITLDDAAIAAAAAARHYSEQPTTDDSRRFTSATRDGKESAEIIITPIQEETPAMSKRQLSNQAAAAAAIRKELKAAFPTVTFKVTSKGYSMGDNVSVDWTDGPTDKQVEAITSKYEAGSFDGMTDMYTYHRDRDAACSTKYLHTDRSYSRATLTAFIERHNRVWGTSITVSDSHNAVNWSSGTYDDITHMLRELRKTSFICHACNQTTQAGDAFCAECGAALTECQECHGNGKAWDNDAREWTDDPCPVCSGSGFAAVPRYIAA